MIATENQTVYISIVSQLENFPVINDSKQRNITVP